MKRFARSNFHPREYGISLHREDFVDKVYAIFEADYRHWDWSVDEFLLHPEEALKFCNKIKEEFKPTTIPNHLILWSVLHRRKHPVKA